MRWSRPNNIGTAVEAKAANRPIKIAYLVPFDDTPSTHMNLDAVFFESYTRWAGAWTLVIPVTTLEFMHAEYGDWLERYDPDFIYSYVDLEAEFVEKIDRICCPISILRHEFKGQGDGDIDWRSFKPHWQHYIEPVSSITTVQSPASYPRLHHEDRPSVPTIFTQYQTQPRNRFLADNFGTGFGLMQITYPIQGYLKTLCLVPDDLPENIVAGTERCTSVLDALKAISEQRATPIARLAMINAEGVARVEARDWASAFRLFIGTTPMERINFWNCRHLGNSWNDAINSLSVAPTFFDDDNLVQQLGQYLNKNNFLGSGGGGPYRTEIHSSSLDADALNIYRDKLNPHTWTAVNVSRHYKANCIPASQDLENSSLHIITDTATLKLTEDSSEILANEPAHFIYVPPQLKGNARGNWVVELSIQRHNNLSMYSNVTDEWDLPKRLKVVRAFTNRLAKPTRHGRLALLPSPKNFPLKNNAVKALNYYQIDLPSDETFFRHVALEFFRYPTDDLRALIPRAGYADMEVSDKGQNLRGVITLLRDLPTAYRIFTHRFWRSVMGRAKEDATRPLTFELAQLQGFAPNDRETFQRMVKELRLAGVNQAKQYLRDALLDALEHLVRSNVFYQVASWRCSYCGHANSRSFDKMKIKNACDICDTAYLAPIDISWQYELNDFVYRSLHKHSGLHVLWALGHLQERLHNGAFWYLPEVDLFEDFKDPTKKNEIDVMCMLNGTFYAIEVKRSASLFLNVDGGIEKFVRVMELLRPDVAMLAFDRYCPDGEDAEAIKIRLAEAKDIIQKQLAPRSIVKVLVANDVEDFDNPLADFGWHGRRISSYNH